tara:strand:+ start:41 stop:1084 length:1044 start_codon:yes stop_codon:yes gene_type:complete
MTKSRGIRKQHKEGDIKIVPSRPNAKYRYTDGKWVYVKKPKGYFKKDQPKPEKPKVIFPPVTLPDHIRATKYPHYYVSNDGVAYREPRQCDKDGRFGEVNEYGLIQLTVSLRGNPNYGEEYMYEGINIYFYDENGKNIGFKKRNIHQLVAETWIPNPHGYTEVLHGDKGNRCNHYTNLRWGTHKENMKEAKSSAPEGTIILRKKNGKRGSLYEKKDGEWVLIPSNRPPWNKGMKWGAPDGTVRMRRVNDGYGKFIKQNGEWVYQKKKGKRKSLPDGSISKDGKRKKINGEWVYQKTKRVVSQKKCEPRASSTKVNGLYPDGTITTRSDGTKWKKENGKWVYQKIKIK